jgi:hypothetical protein
VAAGATYTTIATQTLGSAASSVTFSSIPGTYTDLVLVFDGKMATGEALMLQVNSDTGSNYSATFITGDGSTAFSTRNSNQTKMNLNNLGSGKTNQFTTLVQLQNYSNTTTYKTILSRTANASDEAGAIVGLWRSTSAITSITLLGNNSANIASGTVISLYGIAAA